MFEQTFVDGVGKTKSPYMILLSAVVELIALGIIIIIPLIYFDALPSRFTNTCSSLAASATSHTLESGHIGESR